jgi:hypothetical protein
LFEVLAVLFAGSFLGSVLVVLGAGAAEVSLDVDELLESAAFGFVSLLASEVSALLEP